MNRRDFLKHTFAAGAITAAPSISAKSEGEGLYRIEGEHGNVLMDFKQCIMHVTGSIDGEDIYRKIQDYQDQDSYGVVRSSPMIPISRDIFEKKWSSVFGFSEDWHIVGREGLIGCYIEGILTIQIISWRLDDIAEIYINGEAIHNDMYMGNMYRKDNSLYIRPYIQWPVGTKLEFIAVDEQYATKFEQEVINDYSLVVAI